MLDRNREFICHLRNAASLLERFWIIWACASKRLFMSWPVFSRKAWRGLVFQHWDPVLRLPSPRRETEIANWKAAERTTKRGREKGHPKYQMRKLSMKKLMRWFCILITAILRLFYEPQGTLWMVWNADCFVPSKFNQNYFIFFLVCTILCCSLSTVCSLFETSRKCHVKRVE